jgi:hypothetical protein
VVMRYKPWNGHNILLQSSSQLVLYNVHSLDCHYTNKGTQVTLQFDSSFVVCQWTLPWLPGQNISCRHSTVSL